MMQSAQMQQLRQRVTASYHLGPLDKSETMAYVEHRLKHVGWKGDPEFDPACFEVIHSLTAGIPRRINTLCNRLLLGGFLAERHRLECTDVHAIAREIHDELGPAATLSLAPASANDQTAPVEPPPDTATWRTHFRRIEERIDRLEKTVGAAVDLLHRMLHPDKTNKPGSPPGR